MRAAVLGSPIAHSLSPVLHRAAYKATGLDWQYDAIECTAEQLPEFMSALDEDVVGLSLTMPLKLAVLPLLDVVVGEAAVAGAANTVVLRERRVGHNTDVAGVIDALAELGFARAPDNVVVLGAGGTARGVVVALGRIGATSITAVARRPDVVQALADVGAKVAVEVSARPWAEVADAVHTAELVIATTPAGATDELADQRWPTRAALLDVLYDPWPTPLASAARRAGANEVGGLSVLVGQAAAAFTLMTGIPAPYEEMRKTGEAALKGRR